VERKPGEFTLSAPEATLDVGSHPGEVNPASLGLSQKG